MTLTVGQTALPAVTAAAQGGWTVLVPANASYVTEGTLALSAVAAKTGLTDGRASASLSVDLTAPSVSHLAGRLLLRQHCVDGAGLRLQIWRQ